MALEISVGPSQLVINQGNSVLITDRDGQIPWPTYKGLYSFDTRLISSWSIYANGEPWDLLNAGNITHYASRIFLTNRAIATEDGAIAPRSLGLALSRSITGGVHEDLDLVNHGMKSVRFNLEIAIRSDFADLFEVKSGNIVRRGRINGSVWPHDNGIIATGFRRYGFVEEAARIARDVSAAASYFMLHQIPELYSGMQRDPTNFLGANVPQAWAAGSAFAFLQIILGFQPDAPRDKLYIDPVLPNWLPDLTVMGLRIGQRSFDLRFWRDGESTRWEVLKGDDNAIALRSFATRSGLANKDEADISPTSL